MVTVVGTVINLLIKVYMKVQTSNKQNCKDTVILACNELDYEKLRFLKRIAVGLVNLSIDEVKELICKDNK